MFKIGNVEIKGKAILAPMAGVTNKAFRNLATRLGAAHTYTEMISNIGLKYNSAKTLDYANIDKNEITSLQIFGGDVEDYIEAAKYFDKNSNAKIIDINMGCPVAKVAIKSKSGSALIKTPEKIRAIVKGIIAVINKPLTIKIRIGWDENSLTYLKVAKIAEEEGVAAIAVHGRTREQMYTGKANWDIIKKIKESISIPVIGNGDIVSPESAKKMLDYTGVDAVMIAREARENPWIFKQINEYLETGFYSEKPSLDVIINELMKYYNELKILKGKKRATLQIKGVALHWFSRFKNLKKEKQMLATAKTEKEFWNYIEEIKKTYKNL